MSGIDRKSLIILAEDASNALSTVLVDASRRLVSVFVGSEGATVKQNATGELVTEIQGSESLAVKQKATTGELITEIQGSEALAIKQKSTTGEMIAEMQGSEGIAIAQESATGEMIAIFKALYNSSLITVAADANGRLSADFGLYEQATFDMDTYADGTDNRMSYSASFSITSLKYWINVQNGLIAIRHIDVQGSAALGNYEITLSADEIIAGSTGVNVSLTDTKIYRRTITNSLFDFSETNCTIKGFIVDYLKNANDNSANYTIVAGGASAANAYNDNLDDYAGLYTAQGVVWEVSFPSITVNQVSFKWYYYAQAGLNESAYVYIQLELDSVWTTIRSKGVDWASDSTVSGTEHIHDLIARTLCTGIRILHSHTGTVTTQSKLYDISIFE